MFSEMSEISYLNKSEIKPIFVVKLIFQCLKLIFFMSGIYFNIFLKFAVKLVLQMRVMCFLKCVKFIFETSEMIF